MQPTHERKKVVIARVFLGGQVRAIWDDKMKPRLHLSALPHRASRIEVIEEGPRKGEFSVDFSPLAAMLGDWKFDVSLIWTYPSYDEARRVEVEWLRQNFILEGCDEQADRREPTG